MAEDKKHEASESRQVEIRETEAKVKRRLHLAQRQKALFELDMREGYFFAAPHRMRNVNSMSPPPSVRTPDASLLAQSFGFELCDDFPTVMVNTFFPETQQWCIRRAGPMVPDDLRDQVEEAAAESDRKVFQTIRGSNFYEECGKSFNPDLALGTVAMWIDQPVPWKYPVCQAIPIRELEINIGPDGKVGDRFVVRHTKLGQLEAVLPGKTLPKEIVEKRKRQGGENKECRVVWAFLPIYDQPGVEKWQYCLTIDNIYLEGSILKGDGCCPLIVGRFGATPEWPWAVGPLIKALPDLRMMDELAQKKVEAISLHLRPPISYPDGSFVNIQDGLLDGNAYPIRPGEEGAIKNIYDPPPIDAAIYLTQDLETRLKRLFFLDWPSQDGKTPPTATQWLDEMTMAQRRIGTPGRTFYAEFCTGVFMRFLWLAEKSGLVEPITIGKDKKSIALMPYNPAERSAEQEDVALFARFAQIGAGVAPEEWKITTDGGKTLVALAKKMGVQELWKQRDQNQISGAIENMKQLMGGNAAGAPAMPQGAPPPSNMAGPPANQPTFSIQGNGL